MGKIVSKLKSRNSVNEDEREIQKYAEETENRPYEFGLQSKIVICKLRTIYKVCKLRKLLDL